MIKQSMVDLENLFTLLDEPIEVSDADGARRLHILDAEVKVHECHIPEKSKVSRN